MKQFCRRKANSGFSMIEVLVTMLIVAIGILGVAGLQTTSLRQGNRLQTDLQLQLLAQDLMERAMAFEETSGSGIFATTTVPSSEPNDCSSSCTRAQIVAYELWEWAGRVESVLPAGDFDLDFEDGEYRLAMTWDHDGDGETSEADTGSCESTGMDDCFFLAFRVR